MKILPPLMYTHYALWNLPFHQHIVLLIIRLFSVQENISYHPQIKGMYQLANVRRIFPEIIADSLQEGVCIFDQKLPGYARKDAVISGVESRTSSPVRIIRDDSLQSEIRGIYPCGEGAGYAGGITSAAMDGIKIAEMIAGTYRPLETKK